jgi:hypothetical protein
MNRKGRETNLLTEHITPAGPTRVIKAPASYLEGVVFDTGPEDLLLESFPCSLQSLQTRFYQMRPISRVLLKDRSINSKQNTNQRGC